MQGPIKRFLNRKTSVPDELKDLIDENWYLGCYPDVTAAGITAFEHFMNIGWAEGRNPNPLFDTEWYFLQNPDVESSGVNPLVHYIEFGWREGRSPHPLFNAAEYRHKYLPTDDINPLLHYLWTGAEAKHIVNPLFEEEWYVRRYPEAARNPIAHFIQFGLTRRLSPHPLFDGAYYLSRHPEVALANINPLVDYLTSKPQTVRHTHPLFDADWYVRQYPESVANNNLPLLHYLRTDATFVRQPSPDFDADWYLRTYKDVAKSGMNPLRHFVIHGAREKRNPSASFDTAYYVASNPDVLSSGMNPLAHYVLAGRKEGRRTLPPAPASKASVGAGNASDLSLFQGPGFPMDWEVKSAVLQSLVRLPVDLNQPTPEQALAEARRILAAATPAPRVSVVIPMWNRSATVCDATRSALNQTRPPYEIIVSDDGSEDDSVEKVRNTFPAELNSGLIKIVVNGHLGVSAARNAGLKLVTGDVVAYLDSDNRWRPEYLLLVSAVFAECDEVCTVYAALESHNKSTGEIRIRATPFDRKRLIAGNFIDLNVFAHRTRVYNQCGGFDESLTRLVDWDLIVRYTKPYPPIYLPFIGVDYILDKDELKNITFTENLEDNFARITRKVFQERIRLGVDKLRIAYFVYDYPALSQTFIFNELRWLVQNGYDVKVFYAVAPERAAIVDFEIEAVQVRNADELASAMIATKRNICHSHFAYPGVTNFVMPACLSANISYTFMPHAVDIFHKNNRDRSRLAEISNNPHCLRVFVYGDHHRQFLESKGVNRHKISYNFQAIEPSDFSLPSMGTAVRDRSRPRTGLVIARFIEKKGIEYLIEAANKLRDLQLNFQIYGFGPLAEAYEGRLRELGLTNFDFPGPLESREKLAEAYQRADFLVAPCVEAENGDVDGFPTVILEAIAAGIPVVTTSVSAIPDYLRDGIDALLAIPRDAQSLAEKIRQLCNMGGAEIRALTNNATSFLQKNVGVDNTARRFLDVWSGYEIDLFLVTYNTPKYEDRLETIQIVERLLQRTTTPFNLTIVDNDSSQDFIRDLTTVISGHGNVRLIEKKQNIFCGPASNIALRYGNSEFAVYICSKEGFVRNHGWERPLIEQMRASPGTAMAGYRTHLPRFMLGRELAAHPDFAKFRNQQFAKLNPDRPFKHIQGGVFIARRNTFKQYGWFSDLLPQNMMDVEYSYFLESQGAELGEIAELRSVSIKTLPRLTAVIDETTVIAHPLSNQNVSSMLDRATQPHAHRCNLCGSDDLIAASGPTSVGSNLICSKCGSSPFGRSVGQLIAHDHRTHRGAICICASDDIGLQRFLSDRLFKLETPSKDFLTQLRERNTSTQKPELIVADLDSLHAGVGLPGLEEFAKLLPPGAALIVGGANLEDDVRVLGCGSANYFKLAAWSRRSRYLGLDWRPVALLERVSEARILV